jgi:hypothetical protein
MGDSHYKSDLIGKNGTETISNFASLEVSGAVTGGTIVGTNTVTVPAVVASTYLKVGTKYILDTNFSTSASINAEATLAVGGTVPAGSIAAGLGELWIFASDDSATMYTQP